MTLWDLLIAICFTIPIAGALSSAKHLNVGVGGYALAIIVGLALGISFAWTQWQAGKTLFRYVEHKRGRLSKSVREWCFRALYLAGVFWILVAGAVGGWASSVMMRLPLLN